MWGGLCECSGWRRLSYSCIMEAIVVTAPVEVIKRIGLLPISLPHAHWSERIALTMMTANRREAGGVEDAT